MLKLTDQGRVTVRRYRAWSPRRVARHPYALSIIVIGALAYLTRAVPVLSADFPLNDGGLFLVMVEDLRHARYALPEFIAYNGAQIPFVYPPLGFYLAALLVDLLGIAPEDALRFLPLTVSTATLGAFFVLAHAVLPSKAAAAWATIIFTALPGSFFWLIMGGGLTRSFGLLFAILGLYSAYRLYTRGGPRATALLALFAALTVLSHPALAWFLAFSVALVFLGYGRHRRGILSSLAAAVIALALAAPWWATVLVRHGVSPLVAASETPSLLAVVAQETSTLPGPALVGIGLVSLAAMVGMTALGDPRFFILGWVGSMFFLDIRAFIGHLALPLALADGYLVAHGIVPALRRLRPGIQGSGTRPTIRSWVPRPAILTNTVVAGSLVVLTGLLPGVGLGSLIPEALVALSPEEREAMRWIGEHTPATSTFLVVSGAIWAWDRSSEWFPVLAHRVSVATPQGLEWIPGGEYTRRRDSQLELRGCAEGDASCLERWSASAHLAFSHVYLPKRAGGDCCAPLRTSLESHAAYEVAYDGPGATVFARR